MYFCSKKPQIVWVFFSCFGQTEIPSYNVLQCQLRTPVHCLYRNFLRVLWPAKSRIDMKVSAVPSPAWLASMRRTPRILVRRTQSLKDREWNVFFRKKNLRPKIVLPNVSNPREQKMSFLRNKLITEEKKKERIKKKKKQSQELEGSIRVISKKYPPLVFEGWETRGGGA